MLSTDLQLSISREKISPNSFTKIQISFIIRRRSSRIKILNSTGLKNPDVSNHCMVPKIFGSNIICPQRTKIQLKVTLDKFKPIQS